MLTSVSNFISYCTERYDNDTFDACFKKLTNQVYCSNEIIQEAKLSLGLDWTEQCFTSPPTQYKLYGRRFLRSKDPTNCICRTADRTISQQTI